MRRRAPRAHGGVRGHGEVSVGHLVRVEVRARLRVRIRVRARARIRVRVGVRVRVRVSRVWVRYGLGYLRAVVVEGREAQEEGGRRGAAVGCARADHRLQHLALGHSGLDRGAQLWRGPLGERVQQLEQGRLGEG